MLHEKLKLIYENTSCKNFYPSSTVDNLMRFIGNTIDSRKRNISPFTFAKYAGLAVPSSIQFLLYFSDKDGVFEVEYFIECSRSTCNNRIYLDNEVLNSSENIIECDECNKNYKINDVMEYIKAYFRIRDEFYFKTLTKNQILKTDHNSTFQVLKGLPDDLKWMSPSSLSEQVGEGDEVALDQLSEVNKDPIGNVVSKAVQTFLDKFNKGFE